MRIYINKATGVPDDAKSITIFANSFALKQGWLEYDCPILQSHVQCISRSLVPVSDRRVSCLALGRAACLVIPRQRGSSLKAVR